MIGSDSSDGPGYSKLKNFWKRFTSLNAIRTLVIHGRGQNVNMNRSLGEVDSNLIDDFEGFKTSVREVTADVVEIAREVELEACRCNLMYILM